MPDTNSFSRRSFLGRTVGAAGVAAPYFAASGVLGAPGRVAANDRIQIGVIGTGGQANWHLNVLLKQPDVAITALCDVWQERLDRAAAKVGQTARTYKDYRELLQRADVDAVLIASPPHWHPLQAIAACEAGKDMYLEKPISLSLGEGQAILRAVRKHKPITQVGTQIHAGQNYHRVVDIIRSGQMGKVNVVRTFNVMNQGPDGIGDPPVGDPPAGLDVDFWCGPAPLRYHPLIVQDSYTHGSFMDYSGGWTPNMAPHIIDLPYWALELGHPTSVSASGGRYTVKDAGDAYDIHEVLWQYPGMTMTWMTSLVNSYAWDFQGDPGMRRRLGIYFHAVNGTLATDYGTHQIIPEGDRMKDVPEVPKIIPDSPGHHREWLDCIRTRQQPSCNIEYHHKINVAINLALLSLKLGRSIRFDPTTETIPNDEEANKLSMPRYREPWKLPAEYLA